MLRLVVCEFGKLKRRKLFQIAFLTTFLMPVMYSLLLRNGEMDDMMSVVREENGFLILMPLSVVIAAGLFFQEHDYDTLKNLMCIPVTKLRLTAAKLLVVLLFDVGYELTGYGVGILLTVLWGRTPERWGLQLMLTLGTGILLWAAAMPCIVLVVWCNQSYIISVIIAFAYMILNYLLHISEKFTMAPLGLNISTFLPIPMIFRWLYQYHSMEGAGGEMLEFYQRLSPWFVPTPVVFGVLLGEAAVCGALMAGIYRKQRV